MKILMKRRGGNLHNLGKLPPLTAVEVERYKAMARNVLKIGRTFNISPSDETLKKSVSSMTALIKKPLERYNVPYVLVMEFSPDMRLHYHGAILVRSVEEYDHIRRILVRTVGRTVSTFCNDVEGWLTYMFKSYDNKHEYQPKSQPLSDHFLALKGLEDGS